MHTESKPQLFHSPINEEIFQTFFDGVLKKDNEHLDIGYINDKPFCYIYFLINRFNRNLYYHSRSRIYIEQVVVAQDLRRKGYGKALINHVIKIARHFKITRIELDTWTFNYSAKKCFIRQGFITFQEKMCLTVPE